MALTESQTATLENLNLALTKIASDAPAAFDNLESARALVESVQGIHINDPEDALEIEQATEAHKLIRDSRLQVAKVHKALKEPVNSYAKVIDGHKRDLLAILEPTEKALKAELDKVKEHEAAKARAALAARLEKLRAVGSVYASKPDIVEAYSDEAFEELLEVETAEHVKREEAARVEREAEAKRKAEAEALAARERELAEREAALKAAEEKAAQPEPSLEPTTDDGFTLREFSAVESPVDPSCKMSGTASVTVEAPVAFEMPNERDAIEALLALAREVKASQPTDSKIGAMARAALTMYREAQAVKS